MVRSCQFRSMRGNEVRTFIVLPDRLPISDDILECTCTWKRGKRQLSRIRKPICDIVFCVIDFDVLTFYFCILCIMLHILNGAIHEVEPRWRRV